MSRVAGIIVALGSATLLSAPAVAEGLSFNIAGNLLYDSNPLRLSQGQEARPGESRTGFRFSPSVGANYGHEFGRQGLQFSTLVGRDYFLGNDQLTRNRFRFNGQLLYHLGSRCSGVVNSTFNRRQNGQESTIDDEDPTIPPDDVVRVVNNVQETLAYGVTADCGLSSGLTFGGSANHSQQNNGARTRRFSNSDNSSFSVYSGVQVARGQLQLVGSYSTIDYPNRNLLLDPLLLVSNGVKTRRIGLNYSRPIGSRLSGSLGLSYLKVNPDGRDGYTTPAYNVSLTYHPGTRLVLSVNGSRNILSSRTVGALYRVVDQIGLNANYKLNSKINVNGNLGLTRNKFKQTFIVVDDPFIINRDVSKRAGLRVTYSPRSLYDVSFGVDQVSRSSKPSLYDYDSTKVHLSLGVHF